MKEFELFPPGAPKLIAGPCSAESEGQVLDTARGLKEAGVGIYRAGIWKPRTKPGGFEGVGEKGLEWLAEAKRETGMLTATEVAIPAHAETAIASGTDVLWIGARTAANPFAVQELAETIGRLNPAITVLVKNPVNPDVELWAGALERFRLAGIRRLGLVHRGFSVYGTHDYRNEPCWGIPLELKRRYPQLPLLCDPSHMGGKRELVAPISQTALDIGFDGLMIESHCDPDRAVSDARQQITPRQLVEILTGLIWRRSEGAGGEVLEELRKRIDRLDSEWLQIMAKRMEVSREIGAYKRQVGMQAVQPARYGDLLNGRLAEAVGLGLDSVFVKTLLDTIHEESVRQQIERPILGPNNESLRNS